LRGEIQLPLDEVEEGTRLWYEYIQKEHIEEMEIDWTQQEYFEGWKLMKEDTGSAPGWHFGHMKCIDPESDAAEVLSLLALLPLKTGYVPREWQKGINSMIPKKMHNLRPEKLRLILLMDSRFNHNNKIIGKQMMEFGEKHNLLAEEQYGSRKSKSAIDHALNKRLVLDIIRQTKTPAIYCANDAKSCYDRILLMVAYLTMRKFGSAEMAAKCAVSGLIQMEHRVRTVYGDSESYYGGHKWHDEGKFPHGNGQGNGDGPSLWAAISSPLLQILREMGYGVEFDSPITRKKMKLSAFGFVDDMDFVQTARADEDEEQVWEKSTTRHDIMGITSANYGWCVRAI